MKAQFEGAEGQIDLNIQANTENKVVQAIRPVSVVTGLNQEPSLPDTVTVEYDKGFPKVHKVTWQAVAKEDLAKYHSFDVLGKVEGIENEAHAKVSVEGIIAVRRSDYNNSSFRSSSITRKCSYLPLKRAKYLQLK